MYSAVPPERRANARCPGVANRLGVSLAGVLLIFSQQVLQPATFTGPALRRRQ